MTLPRRRYSCQFTGVKSCFFSMKHGFGRRESGAVASVRLVLTTNGVVPFLKFPYTVCSARGMFSKCKRSPAFTRLLSSAVSDRVAGIYHYPSSLGPSAIQLDEIGFWVNQFIECSRLSFHRSWTGFRFKIGDTTKDAGRNRPASFFFKGRFLPRLSLAFSRRSRWQPVF